MDPALSSSSCFIKLSSNSPCGGALLEFPPSTSANRRLGPRFPAFCGPCGAIEPPADNCESLPLRVPPSLGKDETPVQDLEDVFLRGMAAKGKNGKYKVNYSILWSA